MKRSVGLYSIIALALLPVFLWLPTAQFGTPTFVLKSISQLTALVGTVLFCISFVLSARYFWVEKVMSGLNRAYVYHHLVGIAAFALLLIHPTMSILSYWTISLELAVTMLFPSVSTIPVLLGMLALDVMILLMLITLFIKTRYEVWKSTHQWLGLSLVLGASHALTIGSTIGRLLPLRLYMVIMLALGLYSFVYRMILKYTRRRSRAYQVSSVTQLAGAVEVALAPLTEPIRFEPGQFAFISVEQLGIATESHPFSLISFPGDTHLYLGIKSLGDYTETLRLLETGTKVWVEGGYGAFASGYLTQSKQVWIAGGIGITPFLSMLGALPEQFSGKIWLYYCTKDEKEAVFWKTVTALCNRYPSIQVKACNFQSAKQGRLGAETVVADVGNLAHTHVYVCGPPPMMESLRTQFKGLGVRDTAIHTEEFAIR